MIPWIDKIQATVDDNLMTCDDLWILLKTKDNMCTQVLKQIVHSYRNRKGIQIIKVEYYYDDIIVWIQLAHAYERKYMGWMVSKYGAVLCVTPHTLYNWCVCKDICRYTHALNVLKNIGT